MSIISPHSLRQEFSSPHCPSAAHIQTLGEVPHCPVFYPSEQEYADPFAYIQSIRTLAEPAGGCMIIPPGHDTMSYQSFCERTFTNLFDNCCRHRSGEELKFVTKSQPIHQLKWREAGPNRAFVIAVNAFLASQQGEPRKLPASPPIVYSRPLDFYQLFLP